MKISSYFLSIIGCLFLVASLFVFSDEGSYWPIYSISFAFALIGFFSAKNRYSKILSILVSVISGGLFVIDFIAWL